jgi:cytochrome c oxidase assembly protein subunit 15
MRTFDRLLLISLTLALCVVVLGAYVRLSDAGLGCPDWPGCYGHLTVPQNETTLQHAQNAFPDRPLDTHKAWKEMAHRYLAGTLGLLILALCVIAWRSHGSSRISPVLPTGLLLLVTFQALLGMWTVTLLLKPVIVSAHLLGGMTTLALLAWLAHRRLGNIPSIYGRNFSQLRPWARLGLVILVLQILLGGWTSANYAALACTDFPTCQGSLLPAMDFSNGYHMVRELGEGIDGRPLTLEALTAIHWSHRVGALVTLLYLGWLAHRTARTVGLTRLGMTLGGLLLLQVSIGIGNVVFSLPLPLAVAHNAGAALLLISLVVLNSKTTMKSGR